MLVFPNCKINLGLHILRKRSDGYHDIESLMYPITWCDGLEFVPSNIDSLTVTGLNKDLGTIEQNLVFKALTLLRQHHFIPSLKIHLHKTIPSGAGLGGGSADAAFMLKALNSYFGLNLSSSELQNYALKLGSDCPFFIENIPALAKGRGEILSLVPIDLSKCTIVLVVPSIHISTAEAYSMVKPNDARTPIHEIISMPLEKWKNQLVNDFEQPLFLKYSRLQTIKENLYALGAIYASLSGSGSTVYGIFNYEPTVDEKFPDCIVKVIPGNPAES